MRNFPSTCIKELTRSMCVKTIIFRYCDSKLSNSGLYELTLPNGYTDTVICAGSSTLRPLGSCKGDSGGPLMWRNTSGIIKPRWIQLGTVSGGEGSECGQRDFPGRFVRLNSREIMSFIAQYTENILYFENSNGEQGKLFPSDIF